MKIGIIGGTGIYDLHLLKDTEEIKVHTPCGAPSDLVTHGFYQGRTILTCDSCNQRFCHIRKAYPPF